MAKRKPTILQNPYGPDRKSIDLFVEKLNSNDEDSDESRSLATRWNASGRNLKKMVHADEDLWRDLQKAISATWIPSKGARAYLVPLPSGFGDDNDTPVSKARFNFAMFVLHPDCEKLGGPCEICGKWFMQKTRHRTRYCTRKCASLATAPAAIKTTKKRREVAHDRRIDWAREAITTWESKPRSEGWKAWVIRHVFDQERDWAQEENQSEPRPLTEKSLTRWVNDKELQEPKKRRKAK